MPDKNSIQRASLNVENRNRYRARGWAIALVASVILWGLIYAAVLNVAAAFASSDSQTPYTVTKEGITLPAGVTFPDGGHVNWRTDRGSYGIHFESQNNQPSGTFIGQSFLPFNLAADECVEWVQMSLYDEHFGEGGQQPICNGTETPSSTPTPVATEPAVPSATPTPTPEPTLALPTAPPAPSVVVTDETLPTTSPSFSVPESSASDAPDRLADTGTDATTGLIFFAVIVLLAGAITLWGRRNGLERFGSES